MSGSLVTLEEGLIALVKADATLGPMLGDRVFVDTLPEGVALPALAFMDVGGSSEPTFEGRGVQERRYEFDFCGVDALQVRIARDAFDGTMDGFGGALPNGFVVMSVDYVGPVRLPYDSAARRFWAGSEFYFRYAV